MIFIPRALFRSRTSVLISLHNRPVKTPQFSCGGGESIHLELMLDGQSTSAFVRTATNAWKQCSSTLKPPPPP